MNHARLLFQRLPLLFLVVGLSTLFARHTTGQSMPLPGPAAPPETPTHLLWVNFPQKNGGGGEVATLYYPLSAERQPLTGNPTLVFSQPDPPRCQTDAAHAAPNGRAFLLQYNCEDTLFARLFQLEPEAATPAVRVLPQGYFLHWAPDGQWLLFRDVETDQVWLVSLGGDRQHLLDLPPRTYSAIFAPDGQKVLYATSVGLGFGSEIGLLNLADSALTPWQQFPDQIAAHPAWSPDGRQLAYVLMPDTNIPFVVGELWLADATTGAPLTQLAQVDAGHGYAPVWAPDGRGIVYVRRENPQDIRANLDPLALHSNLYRVEVDSGEITPITQFPDSLVYDAVWSPDGHSLAFTADDAVWLWQPGGLPASVSPGGAYRHPAWLALP